MSTPQWSVKPLWQLSLNGSNIDQFKAVTVAPDGSVYAVGLTASNDQDFAGSHVTGDDTYGKNDAVAAKFTASGEKVWVKTFGGTGNDHFDAVAVAPDGSIVVSGYTDSTDGNLITTSNTGTNTALVAKISADGDLVWATSVGDNSWAILFGVTTAADGSVYAVGDGISDNAGGFGVAAKLTADGKVVWAKTYGSFGVDFWAVAAAPTGGVVIGGDTAAAQGSLQKDPNTPKNQDDGLMVKLGGDGTMAWHKNFPGADGDNLTLNAVAIAPDGGYIATAGGLIVRTTATGEVTSQNNAATMTTSAPVGLAVLPDGSIILGNAALSSGAKVVTSVVQLDADTNQLWATGMNNAPGVPYVILRDVAATADGMVVAVGVIMGTEATDQDAFAVAFKIA